MKDIASHILDITENSVRAKAELIEITILVDKDADLYEFRVRDNGVGMHADQLAKLENPFFTSRKTRKVGLGIPLLSQNCQMSGGKLYIESIFGIGTTVCAQFKFSHIDRPPEGDIADVFVNIATGYPSQNFMFTYEVNGETFFLDTREVKKMFEGLAINDLDVVLGLKEIVKDNIVALKNIQ